MLKFYHILLLTLVAVFIASAASIARYAADSCTQSRMYRQLAALTENFPGDAVSTGNNFLPQYQTLYTQNSDLAGWMPMKALPAPAPNTVNSSTVCWMTAAQD